MTAHSGRLILAGFFVLGFNQAPWAGKGAYDGTARSHANIKKEQQAHMHAIRTA